MKQIDWSRYIVDFSLHFDNLLNPWELPAQLESIIHAKIAKLDSGYQTESNIAIHRDAVIEPGVVIKGPAIIGPNCFIGAHAYLRGGVWLEEQVLIGPGCELKTSVVFSHSVIAHFNFIGDSLIGRNVNIEAGAVVANHFNERSDKQITVRIAGNLIATGVVKFGALIGDGTKIGTNAVLSPGTVLSPNTIVRRLELVE